MNIYLLGANIDTPSNYPDFFYHYVTMDKIWNFSNDHKVFDLREDDILEDSVIILERDFFIMLTGNLEVEINQETSNIKLDTPEKNLQVLDKIKSCKNKRIIILYNYKNFTTPDIDSQNYNIRSLPDKVVLVDILGFEPENIMYITQTRSDMHIIQKIFDNKINATYLDKWLNDLFENQIKPSLTKKQSHLEKNPNMQDKLFSILISRYQENRLSVMFELISQNLLQDFHYTFGLRDNNLSLEQVKAQVFDYINNNLPDRHLPHKNKILEWAEQLPYEASPNELSVFGNGYHHLFSTRLNNFYNHSKINLVLETDFYSWHSYLTYGSIITEKTYKAIFYKKPFIILSQPYALKILKNSGYKTFDYVIDESYDNLPNAEDRLEVIARELLRIRNLDNNGLKNLLDSCQENIEHNYKLLLKEAARCRSEEFNMMNVFGNK